MKKLIISSDKLKPILSILGQAVPKQSTLPALENIYCKVTANQVEFITSDLELTIMNTCEAETTGHPFEMLIPFDFLKKVVSLTKSAPLAIELSGRKAKITGVNDVYELNSLNKPEDYPKLPQMPKDNFLTINGDFIKCMNHALDTVSKDDMRPALTKICAEISKESLTIVSTDAYTLYSRKLPCQSKTDAQLLISPKIAKALEGFDSTEIYWRKSHIGFKSGNIIVIATRCEDKYPDYKAVIPNYEKNLLLDKAELQRALEKCCLTSVNTKCTTLFLKKEKGSILLEADDVDYNRKIDVQITGSYSGPVEKISLSAEKLLKLAGQVDYDKIHLHIHDASKVVLLSAENDSDYQGFIMPIYATE